MIANYIINIFFPINKEFFCKPLLSVLCVLLISTLVAWFISWRISRKHMYDLAKKVPNPSNVTMYPIIGHAHLFIGGSKKIFKNLRDIMDKQNEAKVVWIGHRLFYTVCDPVDLEIILNSPKSQGKDDLYKFAWPLIGQGLIAAPLKKWKKHRRLITPIFNKKTLDNFVKIFTQQSEVLCEILKEHVGRGVFDCTACIENWAVDVICETAMSKKVNSQTSDSLMAKNIHRGFEILKSKVYNVAFHCKYIYNLSSLSKEEENVVSYISEFTKKVIQQKKLEYRERQLEKYTYSESLMNDETKRNSFLDQLIELSDGATILTDEELQDEIQTFIIAGSDSTAITIKFVLIMLGMYPQYQQKVYEEVIEILGHDRQMECTDIPKFVYLDKFIKETMRLFPIGPTIIRKVLDDLQLTSCTVPKSAGIILGIMANQRSEKYFPNPLKFNPERFTPEEIVKRHGYSYLPFSGGSRNCIGLQFAMMSMKTVIAIVVRKYFIETTFKKTEDIEIVQELMISSVSGYPIKVTTRKI